MYPRPTLPPSCVFAAKGRSVPTRVEAAPDNSFDSRARPFTSGKDRQSSAWNLSRGFDEGYETSKSLWLASFVTQRDHRIKSRGAPGGDVACEQSDNGQKQPDSGKRNRIGLTDAKELRLKQARECHSERRAHDEARQCEPESLAKNETVDASLLRAERHADADFPRALASGVSHDAIDADGGQQHGQKTKGAGKRSRDAYK